ncbi:hypothetical protein [Hyphomonas johnsonii]|uniref:DUF2946 domain-containing protein n=1 Tax=Hyphomonas johnsonii MHS-2 TaxID=1280950 RepID=A0A059FPB6_9PROT|nr:hypothetical protein [Hyphomonas johnsonii]KCZ92371.1 hypothetical protein HJO_10059 [Hyphomonas johnsonii MHS-2]
MHRLARLSRHLLLLLAFVAYAANGMQTHLRLQPGETVSVLLCGNGGGDSVDLTFGDGPAEADTKACCGACLIAAPVLPQVPHLTHPVRGILPTWTAAFAPPVWPGSPLWPGAPPQGPPLARKA